MIKLENINTKISSFSLKKINLHIKKGEYFVIVGPTGSGKSSVLNCIAGLVGIDSGNLYLKGSLANHIPIEERKIGYVFQNAFLFPHLNVYDNIAFGVRAKNHSRALDESKLIEISELFGISHLLKRSIKNLSGGESQRVALARCLICRPAAMLLDEPFSSLDRNTAENLMLEFKKVHDLTGQTIVHVTHNQEEAMMLGDRICLMQNGSIMQTGTGDDIFKKPESNFAANFFGACNIYNGISKIKDGVSVIEFDGCRIRSTVLKEGHITCSIRPEDTVISTSRCNPDANNSDTGNFFKGKIEKIVNRGVIIQVYIDAGIPIINYTLRKSFNQMDIKVGDRVNVGFEENDVHIV